MATCEVPYPNFNFSVGFDGIDDSFGGFSDVSGLTTELTVSEYRTGIDPENHVHKIAGLNKQTDLTLKRGVVDGKKVWDWVGQARVDGPGAKKTVTVTLKDEQGKPVQKWTLRGVLPLKLTGPTLAGKGGGDVAMEELTLSVEALDYTPVT